MYPHSLPNVLDLRCTDLHDTNLNQHSNQSTQTKSGHPQTQEKNGPRKKRMYYTTRKLPNSRHLTN